MIRKYLREFLRFLALPLLRDYWAVMCAKRMRLDGTMSVEAERYAKKLLLWGLILDVLYNLIWATIYFRDLPRELLVTQRLKRYKNGRAYRIVRNGWKFSVRRVDVPKATGWRMEETNWLTDNFLDPADPDGKHV